MAFQTNTHNTSSMFTGNIRAQLTPGHQLPRTTAEQMTVLETNFKQNRNPNDLEITLISAEAGMPEADVRGINQSANFRFLQRLSVIFGFRRDCPRSLASCKDYRPLKMASCRDCPYDSAYCREPRQEAESREQSLQEAIYLVKKSQQEARDPRQSRRKPNMTDSLCRKQKLADWFIPCVPIDVVPASPCSMAATSRIASEQWLRQRMNGQRKPCCSQGENYMCINSARLACCAYFTRSENIRGRPSDRTCI